jgi:hypothetical protein
MNRPHSALWLVPAIMLAMAPLPLPYGYYVLLRFVVCAATALLAYYEYQSVDRVSGWAIGFALIAFLFNPFIPVYLSRIIWLPINIVAAISIFAHWRKVLTKKAT